MVEVNDVTGLCNMLPFYTCVLIVFDVCNRKVHYILQISLSFLIGKYI